MTKDTKQTLLGVGLLVAFGAYLMYKKKKILEENKTEESSFVNAGGDKHLRTKRLLKKYNRRGGFQNATGCSSGQLAEAMTHCEGMAQSGETTSIKRCKIQNNGVRRVTCQYTDTGGGIRYIETNVGSRIKRRR
tara:strand:- start:52 stop:453 length:402 start_codon:yes stop_codon:yes gene_type:complete